MQNQIASVANLARAILQSLDHKQEHVSLPTATVALLLNTLIALADSGNPTARKIESASAAFVASRISGVETR